jgi:aspartate carbamoyltransferase catalytic subunit
VDGESYFLFFSSKNTFSYTGAARFKYHQKRLDFLMKFKGMDVISIRDFSKQDIQFILATAKKLEKNPSQTLMKGLVMATLFFEPSTRTRLSFTSAMEKMGGQVLGFENTEVTSISKGETLWDTIRMVDQYADVIVIRHEIEGAARLAAEAANVPIINAGDGANQHPTQTLLDLYTIQKEKGTLDGLKIGFVGDLKYGRTVHSLCIAMSHFKTKMVFCAPEVLQMPAPYLEDLSKNNIPYAIEEDLLKAIKDLDILYMTRIQKERFPDPVEYNKLKGIYHLDKSTLAHAKKDVRILHPLPRVDEIHRNLDNTPNAAYFRQAANAIPVRQAILALVTGTIK